MNDTLVVLLCQEKSKQIESFEKYLNNIVDTIVCIENVALPENYHGLTRVKPSPIAWENAFYTLFQSNNKYKFFYFIEDDVYTKNIKVFGKLIKYYSQYTHDLITGDIFSRNDEPSWYWWEDNGFNYKSFNPLCRLSKKLINKIRTCHLLNNGFYFHEVMFASLAINNHYKILDYNKDNNPYISTIRWRPVFELSEIIDNKIYHPVKTNFSSRPIYNADE